MLDKTSPPPTWVPETYIKVDYSAFDFEQALRAIKSQAQKSDSVIKAQAVVERAELATREVKFAARRQLLRSPAGNERNNVETAELFRAIEERCAEISAQTDLCMNIECVSDRLQCHLRDRVSVLVMKENWLANPKLVMRAYDRRTRMGNELLYHAPQLHKRKTFWPDLNRAGSSGWKDKDDPFVFLTSAHLAERIVKAFVDATVHVDHQRSFPDNAWISS